MRTRSLICRRPRMIPTSRCLPSVPCNANEEPAQPYRVRGLEDLNPDIQAASAGSGGRVPKPRRRPAFEGSGPGECGGRHPPHVGRDRRLHTHYDRPNGEKSG